MDNFRFAVTCLLKDEGEYVNDKNDDGGETNFGISSLSYPNLDIKNLTENDAIKIYERDYWLKYRINEIHDTRIATCMLKGFVNLPPLEFGRVVQTAINKCGANVKIDGIIGSKTIQTINEFTNYNWLLAEIKIAIALYYCNRVRLKPNNLKFLRGWVTRALL